MTDIERELKALRKIILERGASFNISINIIMGDINGSAIVQGGDRNTLDVNHTCLPPRREAKE